MHQTSESSLGVFWKEPCRISPVCEGKAKGPSERTLRSGKKTALGSCADASGIRILGLPLDLVIYLPLLF